jgi:benzoate membrane transport protein
MSSRWAKDLNAAAVWAGITAFVWYAFGAVPLHIAVSEQLGLSTAQTSSWIFIVWFSGAVATIAASLYFRQPIPITWTIPGLIYLGTLAERFTFAELVGANLVAGVLLLALADAS